MKGICSILKTVMPAAAAAIFSISCTDGNGVVVPNEVQKEWAEAEIGVIIHLDMPVFVPEYNFREWGSHPDASVFNPTDLDTDQWLKTAADMGAKYAVLVAKHCSGFSLWPTEAHGYSVRNSPWKDGKGDIVRDFINSCKKYGIRPGIYASTTANGYLHVENPGIVQPGGPVTQEEYNDIVITQLTELWSNYGELFEIWFDGGVLSKDRGGADILPLVQKLQPDAVAFQGPFGHPNLVRWTGNEEGVAPYPCWATADSTTNADGTKAVKGLNGNPDAPFWCPGEADFTLRLNSSFQGGWFWKEGQDSLIFSTEDLMHKYMTSVGRNTNMLVGLVIDDRGLVPEADAARAAEFGQEIRRLFSGPEAEVAGKGRELEIVLDRPTPIDRLIIQEDISYGERVLGYKVQYMHDGEWTDLCSGSCIGHKRIETFPPCTTDRLKLTVTEAKAKPCIRSFRVFRTI